MNRNDWREDEIVEEKEKEKKAGQLPNKVVLSALTTGHSSQVAGSLSAISALRSQDENNYKMSSSGRRSLESLD